MVRLPGGMPSEKSMRGRLWGLMRWVTFQCTIVMAASKANPNPSTADDNQLGRRAARKHCIGEQPQNKQHRKDGDTPQIGGGGEGEQRTPDADAQSRLIADAVFKRCTPRIPQIKANVRFPFRELLSSPRCGQIQLRRAQLPLR